MARWGGREQKKDAKRSLVFFSLLLWRLAKYYSLGCNGKQIQKMGGRRKSIEDDSAGIYTYM